jgi:hypothetical protein
MIEVVDKRKDHNKKQLVFSDLEIMDIFEFTDQVSTRAGKVQMRIPESISSAGNHSNYVDIHDGYLSGAIGSSKVRKLNAKIIIED